MRTYWLHQSEKWLTQIDTLADYGNMYAVARDLAHLDDALREALR